MGAVPGLGRVKKKIDEREDEEDSYTADEVPPSAPDRKVPPVDAAAGARML
jgi:phage shock protein A